MTRKNPVDRKEFYNEMQSLEKERGQLNFLDYQITEQEIRHGRNRRIRNRHLLTKY